MATLSGYADTLSGYRRLSRMNSPKEVVVVVVVVVVAMQNVFAYDGHRESRWYSLLVWYTPHLPAHPHTPTHTHTHTPTHPLTHTPITDACG